MSTGLFFAPGVETSILAKGRGGSGGVQIGSVDDNWDVPAIVKTTMAFAIIWAIASLVQLVYIIKNLRLIPTMSIRAPYIFLAVLTLFTTLGYLLHAILIRVQYDVESDTAEAISLANAFFMDVGYAFRPAVVLWLVHERAAILQTVKAVTTPPLASRPWKRVLDWILPSLLFVIYIAGIGHYATWYAKTGNLFTSSEFEEFIQGRKGISHALVTLLMLLYIDVIASVTIMFIQGNAVKWADPVVCRLLFIVVPLIAILAIEVLATDIYGWTTYETRTIDENDSLNFAQVIIEGLCGIGITTAIVLTMTLPGVQWTAQQTGAPTTYPGNPGQQWSTPHSGSTQPLYNQPQQPYFQQPQQQQH